MIRRDTAQDADKVHYYSSYWIEVAMGREGAQTATTDETDEALDSDVPAEPVHTAPPVAAAPEPRPAKKTAEKKQEQPRSLSSLADLANIDLLMRSSAEMDDETPVDLAGDVAEDIEPVLASDFDEAADTEVAEDEEAFEDFEDEEEDEWGNTRRAKPGKPQPKPRRERRPF